MAETTIIDGVKWCKCGCHIYGSNRMHFRSCCDLCYKKYITRELVNGEYVFTVNQKDLGELIAEHKRKKQ